MNTPWNVIAELEADNSKLAKEAIVEREARSGNTEFFEGVRLAYDAMITFGIAKVPEKTDADGTGLAWNTFTQAVTGFIGRTVTGNAARDAVATLMATATKEQWNGWYRRILIKDMRAGFSETTVNKVCKKTNPKFVIPVFECQLAHDSANHEEKLCGKKLVETKLDGVRVLTIVHPNGRVDQFSRNGKELVNFPHIKEQFSRTVTGLTEPTVFDGEVMSGSFQDLMKQIHRKDNVQASDAVLHLFDFLPLRDFQAGGWNRPQIQRSEKLRAWKDLWANETPNIAILDQQLVDLDTDEGQAEFKAINARAIAGGYEGIMIKDPEAGYECKRTVKWMKLKPFIEVSLTVVDTEEGTGKNVGRMGALVCEGVDDGRQIRVNVGSGFSDQQREDFWSCRADGHIVEVRADAVTQNQDGTFSLRFPRFKSFRGFEVGEKI
jgi:DNA ligase-1